MSPNSIVKPPATVNAISNNFVSRKNYYSKPSFPDVQLEERNYQLSASYDGSIYYEWNIDGMSEHQIINLLHEMMMAANAYRIKINNSNFHAVDALVIGFTGLLKGWWDHYLSQNDREYILNAKKTIIKEEGTPIQSYEEDVVNTLIFAITKHFIGDPVYFQERTSEILNNLKCPKLQDFKWYKDMFLVKVMSRHDCGSHYWKEKFISGLPTLFAEKVRQRIRNIHNGRIPYESLTYGELITFINNEGLAICTYLKLKSQMKKEKQDSKKELGKFCSYYGYDTIIAPSKIKNKQNNIKG